MNQEEYGIIKNNYSQFRDDPIRVSSPEIGFGIWYQVADNNGKPLVHHTGILWRVAWIEDTGELYGSELIPNDNRQYIIYGVFPTKAKVEAYMRGWDSEPKFLGPLANIFAITGSFQDSSPLFQIPLRPM